MKLPIAVRITEPSPTSYNTGFVTFDQGRLPLAGLVGTVAATPPVLHLFDDCGLKPLVPVLVATADAFAGMDFFCLAIQEGRPARERSPIPNLGHTKVLSDLKEFPGQMQKRLSPDSLLRFRASLGNTQFQHLQLELAVRSIPRENLEKKDDPPHILVSAGVGISVPHIGIVSLYQNFFLFGSDTLVKGASTFICLDMTNPSRPFDDSNATLYRLTLRPSQKQDEPHPIQIDDENGLRVENPKALPREAVLTGIREMERDKTGVAKRAQHIAGILGFNFDRVMNFLGRKKEGDAVTIDPEQLIPPSVFGPPMGIQF